MFLCRGFSCVCLFSVWHLVQFKPQNNPLFWICKAIEIPIDKIFKNYLCQNKPNNLSNYVTQWLTDSVNLCARSPLARSQVPSNYHSEIQRSKDVLYITVCNHVISALLGLSIMKVYNTHVLARIWVNSVIGERQQQQPPVSWGCLVCKFERIWPIWSRQTDDISTLSLHSFTHSWAPPLRPDWEPRVPYNGSHLSERVIEIIR